MLAYFLLRWRKKVYQYENQQQNPSLVEGNVTLTHLFYDIIDIMEKLKKVFIVLSVFFVFYLQWFFRFFINQIDVVLWEGLPSLDLDSFSSIMPWLNVILQVLLIIYLFMNWRHIIRWNRKLTKLKALEQQIYRKLDLEGGLLLVYGNEQDLEEVKQLLLSQKQKFTMKSAHILDNEEFEKRLGDIVKESE
jgi:hypothetical protein